jgi:hypothetical protein
MVGAMSCLARVCSIVCLAVLLGAPSGCAPTTSYRYTAFAPAVRPLAWDGRAAAGGTLRLEGTITHSNVETNYAPQIHDTALFVPEWTAEGSAMLAVTSEIEVGVRGSYAAYQWADPSAAGTMPLPSEPGTWGVGPELRVAVPFDKDRRFALGVAANIMRYSVPYAEWSLTGPQSPNGQTVPCTPSSTCVNGYSLYDQQTESHLVYSFGLYPSIAIGDRGEYGHAFAMIGGTNGFKNDGFTDKPTNGSSVDVIGPVWLVGAGYGFSYDALRVSGMLFRPFTNSDSAVNYSFGFQLNVGVNIDLWSADNDRD